MRVIKLGMIILAFLFLITTLISFLFPSHIRLSKATNLPNERRQIFALIKNDIVWHPAYRDTASATAFANIQKKIVEQTDSTYVLQLREAARKTVISGWQLYGTPASDSLTLQWYMDFQPGWYPWQKFSSLFYEKIYGAMMEQGLANLKQQLIK